MIVSDEEMEIVRHKTDLLITTKTFFFCIILFVWIKYQFGPAAVKEEKKYFFVNSEKRKKSFYWFGGNRVLNLDNKKINDKQKKSKNYTRISNNWTKIVRFLLGFSQNGSIISFCGWEQHWDKIWERLVASFEQSKQTRKNDGSNKIRLFESGITFVFCFLQRKKSVIACWLNS